MCTSNKLEKKRRKKGKQRRSKNGRYKRRRLNTSNIFIFGKNDVKGPRLMEKETEMRLEESGRERQADGWNVWRNSQSVETQTRRHTEQIWPSKFENCCPAVGLGIFTAVRFAISPLTSTSSPTTLAKGERRRRTSAATAPQKPHHFLTHCQLHRHRHSTLRRRLAEAVKTVKISKHFSRHQLQSLASPEVSSRHRSKMGVIIN